MSLLRSRRILLTNGQALEFGAKKLWDVEFMSILSLSSEKPTPVDVRLNGTEWSVHSATASEFAKTWPPTVRRPC